MSADMEFVRDSLKDIREHIKEIRQSIGKLYEKREQHEKDCPALQAFLKKPSLSPRKNIPWWNLLIKIGPFVLAAALGLVGLGAYFGGQSHTQKIEEDLKAVKKLLKESE